MTHPRLKILLVDQRKVRAWPIAVITEPIEYVNHLHTLEQQPAYPHKVDRDTQYNTTVRIAPWGVGIKLHRIETCRSSNLR